MFQKLSHINTIATVQCLYCTVYILEKAHSFFVLVFFCFRPNTYTVHTFMYILYYTYFEELQIVFPLRLNNIVCQWHNFIFKAIKFSSSINRLIFDSPLHSPYTKYSLRCANPLIYITSMAKLLPDNISVIFFVLLHTVPMNV